jgi:NAD(P)-dependent dehydrogenase (short-subunit alcohol dehydrogenase family)
VNDHLRCRPGRRTTYGALRGGEGGSSRVRFTRALAREVGGDGITVNNVALATIDTIGVEGQARTSAEVAERIQRQLKLYVVRRLGRPDDVAGLVTFLAGLLASWITGQTYPVNGGCSVNQ